MDHKDTVSDVALCPGKKCLLASTSFDGTIKIVGRSEACDDFAETNCADFFTQWDLIDDGNLVKTLTMNKGKCVYACRWSPDAKNLATCGDKNVS